MAADNNPSGTNRTTNPSGTIRNVRVRQAAARAAVSASIKTGRAVDPRVKKLAESSDAPPSTVRPAKAVRPPEGPSPTRRAAAG